MRFSRKAMLRCLATTALLAAGGCGGDQQGPQPDPASIGGPQDASARPADASDPSTAGQTPVDPLHPTVVFETSLGKITVELDAEKTPWTVENFLSYVTSGHYDQTIFHQVIKDHPKVVLGGAFTADGTEKPANPPIINEAHSGLKNTRGTLAMARRPDAVDSATCHFFFNLADNEVLDHKDRTLEGYGYCAFGRVVEGMDVVDRIAGVEVHDTEQFERIPVEPVLIERARLGR